MPRASGPVFKFWAPGLIFVGTKGIRFRFHVLRSRTCFRWCRVCQITFSARGLIFGGLEGDGSRFDVLHVGTSFRRYRGRQISFLSFSHPNSFSAVPRVSGPIFIFCAAGHVCGGTESVGYRFHVLRSRTRFRGYRGRRVPFSCFVRPYSFMAVPRASGLDFMFCALGHVFNSTEGVRSRFHVLRARTGFRRYRGRRVSF
jgi:hypothetical protein